ncbi:MAG: winged helix-turn-helix transcriptional regulator [Frankia sp.]
MTASDGAGALGSLVELLARRHSLDAFWELRTTPLPFRTLAQRLDVPPARLSQRLTELREAGVIDIDESGEYRLTAQGRRLLGALEPVAAWAEGWRSLSPRQRVPRGSATRARDEP